ncbi:MAG: hypothetical protein KKA42_06515 [candidate division Zixibacteria bacterium]|nr:hypothetical protein [candidate division Zixibacteria bacterium]
MAGGAAAAAAVAQAIKASGAIVKLEPREFSKILDRIDTPLVVTGKGGMFYSKYQYLTSYKGLFFFTLSSEPISYPTKTEFINARHIWIP